MSVQSTRRWAIVPVVVVLAAVLAACGGGDDSSSPTTTKPAGGGGTSTTQASSGSGDCYTTPGKQKARVRFVNFFTNATYPAGSIDVYQGSSADDPCGRKLATVPFGSASDYIDVTASDESGNWTTTAYVAGSKDDDKKVMSQSETWEGGEAVTIVFSGGDPSNTGPGLPASSGSVQAFFENGDTPAVEEPPAGKAAMGIAATSLQYVDPDGSWQAGLSGRSGCLPAVGDTDGSTMLVGGTQMVEYQVDPGTLAVGLFPSEPGTCEGTPAIGPSDVDAAAGSRTFVFAYGADTAGEKLLVLPIESK